MMSSIVSCKNLTLGYGRNRVLDGVCLEIPSGCFLPFIGPNGAGKTTLIRGILGLIKPFSGELKTSFHEKPAGYVPQHKSIDTLFPLTAKGVIKMGFYPELGWWRQTNLIQKKLLSQVIEELHLNTEVHKNYRDLSGGTQQKVLIARALVSKADVLIMDEPTSELDEASETDVLKHLLRLVEDHKKTVLMVHHNLHHPALKKASHACWVNHGKIKMVPASQIESSGAWQ